MIKTFQILSTEGRRIAILKESIVSVSEEEDPISPKEALKLIERGGSDVMSQVQKVVKIVTKYGLVYTSIDPFEEVVKRWRNWL